MHQQAPDVELRISELQSQIDRLSLALHQWHPTSEFPDPIEERLAQLLERCTEALSRMTAIDERHTKTVAQLEARLSDWTFVESRLEQDSDQRIRQFERIIEHEWETLRKVHEEPARQLREQAASLGETCIAAANLALRGFERSEARFAALEAGLQNRMTQLANELQGAVAELRSVVARRASLPGDVAPFPLESVMRIHEEMRRADGAGDSDPPVPHVAGDPAGHTHRTNLQLLDGAAPPHPPSMEQTVPHEEARGHPPAKSDALRRAWRPSIVLPALAVIGAIALAWWLQRSVQATLNDAATRVAAAETATQQANQRVVETQEDADRKLLEARQTAVQAQIMTNVLAAPDLIRFNLAGGPAAPRAYAQVLWSRSRGLVFSASRLPPVPAGATYQLWLTTNGAPVSAGLFVPDSAGRATVATDSPPNIPRPVIHAVVTVEPSDGRPLPTGDTVLTRAQ